jgi:hypothetical protein
MIAEFDKCEIDRDTYPLSDQREAGIGSVAVACIWLAFYIIGAVHSLASGNSNRDATVAVPSATPLTVQSLR